MLGEKVLQTQQDLLLAIGEGQIDPATRIKDGELTADELIDFKEGVASDKFFDEIPIDSIPKRCVDGRGRKDGLASLGANAAGGTYSLVAADALTANGYRLPGEKAAVHAKSMYHALQEAGHVIGGHDDDHAAGNNCGCGAEDKFDNPDPNAPSILAYIIRRGADIQAVLAELGVTVSDELNEELMTNAQKLIDEKYASSGRELRDAIEEIGGQQAVETYTGSHNEVTLVVNTQAGTSLNRQKLAIKYGDRLQAFCLDLENLRYGTSVISLSAEEAHKKFIAALYYNVATASVLAGPSLAVVVR